MNLWFQDSSFEWKAYGWQRCKSNSSFFLAGIDHSKGRGCRVMFPEVVGQFTVKYKRSHSSLQGHSVVYVDVRSNLYRKNQCFVFYLCVCVACAAAIGRNSLRPLVAALEGLSEIEEACACWTVFPRMHAKSEGSYAHATSSKLVYFISSGIFNEGFACHLWFGCNMLQQHWPTSNWKVYTCWCRAELARALLTI